MKETVQAQADKLAEFEKKYPVLEEAWKTLETKHQDFIKETESKKLLETQDSDAKLKERDAEIQKLKETMQKQQEEIDTLKLKGKPDFKGKTQPPEKAAEANKVLDWKRAPYT